MNTFPATGEELASALHTLGVDFIFGKTNTSESLHEQPGQLVAALAESREARLRLSLIPLFLEHPDFSRHARTVARALEESARVTVQCYYTAAALLQRQYRAELEPLTGKRKLLPDLFSEELGLRLTTDPEHDLRLLAKQHQSLSGMDINWLGTYQHALCVWMRGVEIQKS